MSYKLKQLSDGSMQIRNKTSEMTAQAFDGTGGYCKNLTATYTVPEYENGLTYFLGTAAGFVTTLPAPFLGAHYTFIVKTAPTGSYTIVTASSANIIKGIAFNGEAAGVGDSGSADDTISFVLNSSLAGDNVELWSDGTSWFAKAFSKLAASITFTQAST